MPSVDEIIAVVQQVGLFADILRFALNSVFKEGKKENLVKKVVRVREAYHAGHAEALADWASSQDCTRRTRRSG